MPNETTGTNNYRERYEAHPHNVLAKEIYEKAGFGADTVVLGLEYYMKLAKGLVPDDKLPYIAAILTLARQVGKLASRV